MSNGTSDIQLLHGQVKIEAWDLCIDSKDRRKNNTTPFRRALVHDFNDGLTLNWANDYTGGVTIHGLKTINAKPKMLTSADTVHLTITGNTKIAGNLDIDGKIDGDLNVEGRVLFRRKSVPGSFGVVGQPPAPPLNLAEVIFTLQQEIAALKKKVGL